jgi:hypothetical protein
MPFASDPGSLLMTVLALLAVFLSLDLFLAGAAWLVA